jgi:hypothetical protein
MDYLDVNREFNNLWGNVEICGIELRAGEVLAKYDPDAYEIAVDNYALGKGYYHCPDRGEWFESYEAMKEFDSEIDAAEYVLGEERGAYVG